jgi:serine/threonine protein kinase
VKLTDFGIARAVAQTRITQVGSVVGTAAYLSPEQVRGEEATPATDVYALGVVLYQFLTGRLPYEGSTLAELAVRQQNESPLPPSTYNPEVPETLGAAVLRGLQGEDVALPPAAGEGTATAVLGSESATRRLDETGHTDFRPAQSQTRRPTMRQQERQQAPRAVDAPSKRGAFSRFARFVLVLVALVLIAAVVATGVILTTDKASGVHITRVAGNTIEKVSEKLENLVKDNTK